MRERKPNATYKDAFRHIQAFVRQKNNDAEVIREVNWQAICGEVCFCPKEIQSARSGKWQAEKVIGKLLTTGSELSCILDKAQRSSCDVEDDSLNLIVMLHICQRPSY